MTIVCCICKKNEVERQKVFTFEYDGFKFVVRSDLVVCKTCAKKRYVEIFEEHKDLIRKMDGAIKVNWKNFSDRVWSLSRVLISLGVLSYKAKGNWEIVSDIELLHLNPRSCGQLYFRRKEDAIEFGKARLSDTPYDWTIRHISKEISKKEILESI